MSDSCNMIINFIEDDKKQKHQEEKNIGKF